MTGSTAPTPATPTAMFSNRNTPPTYPSETTLTDPVVNSPRPCVEMVRSPSGGIPAVTDNAPSSASSRSFREVRHRIWRRPDPLSESTKRTTGVTVFVSTFTNTKSETVESPLAN